jgi:eukaryotic-like serine/threonine-protein kinase
MPLEGLQLGRYRLLNALGSGGMGEVYLAEDTHIHRQVAIKIVRSEATPYPNTESAKEAERLFRREIRAIATLDHPHILPLAESQLPREQMCAAGGSMMRRGKEIYRSYCP